MLATVEVAKVLETADIRLADRAGVVAAVALATVPVVDIHLEAAVTRKPTVDINTDEN